MISSKCDNNCFQTQGFLYRSIINMNKTYRVVFNHQRNAFVVVSELAHTR
ncbi:MAG: ESPR domain-containing protein [Neisseriaceae bacterium]|nr:ESPR domain-containing protein [Neisseriaceae bacterium]